MSHWRNIVNLDKLELTPGPGREPYLGDYIRPATEMGAKKLGFNVRTIPSGQFSCPYHFHHEEEELFLVLEGIATLRQENRYREVKKGDLIFLTTGPEGAHQFYNHGKEPCKLLAISNRDTQETVEYPDSKKISSSVRKVLQNGVEVDYWKDELNPMENWPKEFLKPGPQRD